LNTAGRLHDSSVKIGKVLSILDSIVGQNLPIHHHEDRPVARLKPQHRASRNAEKYMAELIQVVVKNLPERAAVICPPGLLAIDCIKRGKPKDSQCVQNAY